MSNPRRIIRHVEVETAIRRRDCRRNRQHKIAAGEPCLTIREHGTPIRKSYCSVCALEILKLCAADLRSIRDSLYGEQFQSKVAGLEQANTVGQQLVAANQKARQTRDRDAMQITDYQLGKDSKTEQYTDSNNRQSKVVPIFSLSDKYYSNQ